MKIYTITFSCTTNVGAALQEFALFSYLKNLGPDVKVVDYRPKVLTKNTQLSNRFKHITTIPALVRALGLLWLDIICKIKFHNFTLKNIATTTRCYTANDIEQLPQPDLYICGSDQIWNPEITNYDNGFFLQFDTTALKSYYAASIGKDSLSEAEVKNIIKRVSLINLISIREDVIKKILPDLTNAVSVLDPVFLLNKESYIKIESLPRYKNYILVYEAEINKNCADIAKHLSLKYNLKTIQIKRINNRYKLDKVIATVSPTEFIGLIHHANIVVTNSFHGVALSIILEKSFYYVALKERSERVKNLLNIGNICHREVNSIQDLNYIDIDYSIVNKNLEKSIDQSKQFIKDLL